MSRMPPTPDEPDLDSTRRRLMLHSLSVLGGAALLKGCAQGDTSQAESQDAAGAGSVAVVAEALIGSTSVNWFDTYAELRGKKGGATQTSVNISFGRDLILGGLFAWTTDTTSADDNGTIIVPTGTRTGCWKRVGPFEFTFNTYADLRGFVGAGTKCTAFGLDESIGGLFAWTADTTSADNAGTNIVPMATPRTGCWKRVYSGALNVKWFGAKGDGVANDQPAIVAAINYATSLGRSMEIYIPPGRFGIQSTIGISPATQGIAVSLAGAGMETTTLIWSPPAGHTADDAIILGNPSGVQYEPGGVRDLTILSPGATSGAGLKLQTTTRTLVQNVAVKGFSAVGGRGMEVSGTAPQNTRLINVYLQANDIGLRLVDVNELTAVALFINQNVSKGVLLESGGGINWFGGCLQGAGGFVAAPTRAGCIEGVTIVGLYVECSAANAFDFLAPPDNSVGAAWISIRDCIQNVPAGAVRFIRLAHTYATLENIRTSLPIVDATGSVVQLSDVNLPWRYNSVTADALSVISFPCYQLTVNPSQHNPGVFGDLEGHMITECIMSGSFLDRAPDAAQFRGARFAVNLLSGTGTLTINARSGQTIEGQASLALSGVGYHSWYSDGVSAWQRGG
jgi:hypothetical protein